jgi:hypothetical protein
MEKGIIFNFSLIFMQDSGDNTKAEGLKRKK